MEVRIDIANNAIKVGDKSLDLNLLRAFILQYWHPLARANAIRPVISKGEILYTFDWAKIFSLAVEGGIIIEEFLKKQNMLYQGIKPVLVQTELSFE